MTAGIIMNLALSDQQELSVTPELCKRVRFRQSDCQHCIDTCPEQAIELALGPTINDQCTQCGLCVNACPTEVFHHARSADDEMLKQISAWESDPSPNKRKRLFIHCQAAEKPHRDSHKVNCLGDLSENTLLAAGLAGLDEMVLTRGTCAECHLAKGEALFEQARETFQALQQPLSLTDFRLRIENSPKDKARAEKLSRREFFTRIADNVKERTGPDIPPKQAPALQPHPAANYARLGTRPSTRRSQFQALLHDRTLPGKDETDNAPLPWHTMQVDEANCVGCGICVAVCPTGALVKEYEGEQLVRTYHNALCTDCGLCQEACPQQVIGFTPLTDLHEIVEDTPRVVARIDLHACLVCGEIIPVKEGKTCTTCQKRQLTPVFM